MPIVLSFSRSGGPRLTHSHVNRNNDKLIIKHLFRYYTYLLLI